MQIAPTDFCEFFKPVIYWCRFPFLAVNEVAKYFYGLYTAFMACTNMWMIVTEGFICTPCCGWCCIPCSLMNACLSGCLWGISAIGMFISSAIVQCFNSCISSCGVVEYKIPIPAFPILY